MSAVGFVKGATAAQSITKWRAAFNAAATLKTRGRVQTLLGIMGLLGVALAATWLAFPLLGLASVAQLKIMLAHMLFLAVISAMLWLWAKFGGLSHAQVAGIGLVHVVVSCMVTASAAIWFKWNRFEMYEEFGPGPLRLVTFPLLVPLAPRIAVSVGLLCALAPAIALTTHSALGLMPATPESYVVVSHIPLICLGGTYAVSRTVHNLTLEAAQAKELGAYKLEEKLGAGGMGEVWRATHRLLARPAAVKLIRPADLADRGTLGRDQLIQRFEREARGTAALTSPNTVRLYDFGQTDAGLFYYVMELLDGINLDRLIRGHGPMPPARAVHVLLQACDSLADAHAVELVHRDIKPANILLCRRGLRSDVVKLVDFGLIALKSELLQDGIAPGEDAVIGTPGYIAPEVASQQPSDHRVDIYALGCVGYWLLTGQLVFPVGNPLAQYCAHLTQTPEPPSSVDGVSVPAALDRIILDCIAKSPDDRPRSAVELADRLRATGLAANWTERDAAKWWEPITEATPSQPALSTLVNTG